MKFRVKDLYNHPVKLEVTGQEEWLKDLYSSFPSDSGKKAGNLTASLTIAKDVAGFVQVTGNVNFTPFVDCSRCSESILWPVDEEVNAVFRPATPDTSGGREVTLTKDELDHYVITEGTIDIEELLNDVIQMAIPISTVQMNDENTQCLLCGLKVDVDLVYGKDEPIKDSPFSVLNKVKNNK